MIETSDTLNVCRLELAKPVTGALVFADGVAVACHGDAWAVRGMDANAMRSLARAILRAADELSRNERRVSDEADEALSRAIGHA